MNQPTSLYLASLLEVEWQKPEEFEFPNEFAKHWLEEQGSLSRRLKQHCQELTVELLQNHIVTAKTLKSDESQLLSEQDCLLRGRPVWRRLPLGCWSYFDPTYYVGRSAIRLSAAR